MKFKLSRSSDFDEVKKEIEIATLEELVEFGRNASEAGTLVLHCRLSNDLENQPCNEPEIEIYDSYRE